MKLGLFRTIDCFLGECARVHEDAGDASPYLKREIYELLRLEPAYDDLPLVAQDLTEPVMFRIGRAADPDGL